MDVSGAIRVDALVMAGASVAAHTSVGIGCILNPNSVADHDGSMAGLSDLGVGCITACTTAVEEVLGCVPEYELAIGQLLMLG